MYVTVSTAWIKYYTFPSHFCLNTCSACARTVDTRLFSLRPPRAWVGALGKNSCQKWAWLTGLFDLRNLKFARGHSAKILSLENLICTKFTAHTNTHAQMLVSEPDPRKIEKEGLAHRLGWKCTSRPV